MIDGNTQTKTTSIWPIDVHVETKPAAGPLSFCFVFVFMFVVVVVIVAFAFVFVFEIASASSKKRITK